MFQCWQCPPPPLPPSLQSSVVSCEAALPAVTWRLFTPVRPIAVGGQKHWEKVLKYFQSFITKIFSEVTQIFSVGIQGTAEQRL